VIANPGIWTSAMPSPATVRTLWPSVARAPVHLADSMATPSVPPSRKLTMTIRAIAKARHGFERNI